MLTEKSYFICTIPRSGSWLLSETLEQTGIAGRPREHFHEIFEDDHFVAWNVDSYADYLTHLLANGTTPNGVFGSKLHWYQFEQLHSKLGQISGFGWMDLPHLLDACFPALRYVWLTRHDKARQAVSHYRAIATGNWWKIDRRGTGDHESTRADHELEFDYSAIARLEQLATSQESNWARFFAEARLSPLTISYEQLVERRRETITRVLDDLAIPVPPRLDLDVRLRRQSDELTEEWLARYLELKESGAPIDAPSAALRLRGIARRHSRGSHTPSQPTARPRGAGRGPNSVPSAPSSSRD